MKYRFSDLADIPKLQELMGSLYWLTAVSMGIIEADGTFLFCAGWSNLCQSPDGEVCDCQKFISGNLDPVSYTCHRCPTGMLHYSCPVTVEGEHLASVYIGQFFTEPPDKTAVQLHAAQRGLDPEAYYKELSKFAVVQPMKLTLLLKYLNDLANMLAEIGLQRLKQMEALDILRQNEERLQFISRHDALTGLLNRASFEESLAGLELAPVPPFAIVVLDLDGLKRVNDKLGHPSGDALLCEAAAIIRESAPATARVFRIGGDEFTVLLPEAGKETVDEFRRLLQEKIERRNQRHETLKLGISAGSAVADSGLFKPRELFMEADSQMYREKSRHASCELRPA